MAQSLSIPGIALTLTGVALSACAGIINAPDREQFLRMPVEVRMGAADMAIEPVEQGVTRAEVLTAVQAMVAEAPLCLSWPGLWLDPEQRRDTYIVRYDLMTRDWGETASARSRERMQEFVDMGLLTQRDRPDLGAGIVEYVQTEMGGEYLRSTPYGGDGRPEFCAPSQRRLVEITAMEWGRFPCGNLSVSFTHIADDWPEWARTRELRERVGAQWAPPGVEMAGAVSLSRQWFRMGAAPDAQPNGALRSVCYDSDRRQIVDGDLNLHAGLR